MGKGDGKGKGGGSPIKHIVILMLENHSFDNMLGYLKTQMPALNGLTGTESNPYVPSNPSQGVVYVSNDAPYVTNVDPDHSVQGTQMQEWGYTGAEPVPPIPMNGFVASYNQDGDQSDKGAAIMQCYDPSTVPSITSLAQGYAVFDKWFASVPGPTQPNRMYAYSATSHGAANNDTLQLLYGYPQKTIFESLEESGYSWADYFSDVPGALIFKNLRQKQYRQNFKQIQHFYDDCASGNLPNYCWLEPRYFKFFQWEATDQHPPHPVNYGDYLIADIYQALTQSPIWNECLFIVTYDEHGGFYDHVPPPQPVPNPDGIDSSNPPFDFQRLGIRIPVVMASPWVKEGTIISSPLAVDKPTPNSQFEHSSIPATIKDILNLPSFLTKRDAWAATFTSHLSNDAPRSSFPLTLPRAGTKEMQLLWSITESEKETPQNIERGKKLHLESNDPITDLQREFLFIASGINGGHHDVASINTEHEGAIFVRKMMAEWFS